MGLCSQYNSTPIATLPFPVELFMGRQFRISILVARRVPTTNILNEKREETTRLLQPKEKRTYVKWKGYILTKQNTL